MIHIVAFQESFHDRLVEIWCQAVRHTHHFLAEEDFQFFHEMVKGGVLREVELWVAVNGEQEPVGFIGLDGSKVEMLFVDPAFHGKGTGRQLLQHAERLKGSVLRVDVNEQNAGARVFYERYGFRVEGRSEQDSSGRPYPLLHLALSRE